MDRLARWSSMWVVAALAAVLAGCGGGPGSFQGNVSGMTLDVKDSLFLAHKNSSGQVAALVLIMTSKAGLCEAMKSGSNLSSLTYFQATLAQTASGQSETPTAGDFTVTNGSSIQPKFALIGMSQTDTACHSTINVGGAGGTITLSQFKAEAGGTMTGTFDATFGGQSERGTGNFNADFCDAVPSSSPTCQ